IVELKEVVRLAPNDFRPHYLLAIMYSDFEQHTDAIQQATDALTKGATENVRKDLLLVTARSQIALLQFDEALEKLEQVPACGEEALLRARCLIAKGDATTVPSLIERAKQELGETPELALLECDFLEQENHPEEAATRLDATLQKFSTNAELLYRSSLLHKQLGHNDLAAQRLADWEVYRDLSTELTLLNLKAIQAPFDAEVRDRLAEICTKLNKPELATMWREAANACREKSRQQGKSTTDSSNKAE
ncbi:MAG: hypothetical protein JNM43_13115, partial [Planctomycetaceae bacterium]|nr:hypothetical protein [Planctomycetaceae bacterium]